jgi:hypothetical protein
MSPAEIFAYIDRAQAVSDSLLEDDGECHDDAPHRHTIAAGFVELLYLWCATYRIGTASLPEFQLSSTSLSVRGRPGDGAPREASRQSAGAKSD